MDYPKYVIVDLCENSSIILIESSEREAELKDEINGILPYVTEFTTLSNDIILSSNIENFHESTSLKELTITDLVNFLLNASSSNRRCKRCGSYLIPSPIEGYVYECPRCYESLYAIETKSENFDTENISKEFEEFVLNILNQKEFLNIIKEFQKMKGA